MILTLTVTVPMTVSITITHDQNNRNRNNHQLTTERRCTALKNMHYYACMYVCNVCNVM